MTHDIMPKYIAYLSNIELFLSFGCVLFLDVVLLLLRHLVIDTGKYLRTGRYWVYYCISIITIARMSEINS
jgi:hypothetical protein